MSLHDAHAVASRLNLRPALLWPHHDLAADLRAMATAVPPDRDAAWQDRKAQIAAAFGFGTEAFVPEKPFAFAEGLAMIPVHGVLVNRYSWSWSFATGYNFIRAQVESAVADPDVKAIVLDVNSPGGQVAGCEETAGIIREANKTKPVVAVVDASAYSAAMWISSAAGKIVCTPSGGAGSIGVVATHLNVGPALKEMGIEVSFIFAGKHKVDGNPYEALSDSVKAAIQKDIDATYTKFVAAVAANRNMDEGAVRATEADTYSADDALALGLVDAVQPPAEAIGTLLNELSSASEPEDEELPMTTNASGQPPVDAAAIAAQARSDERARQAAIRGCEEARGREALAEHLATNTDMSADDAKKILAAAPVQVAAPPAGGKARTAAFDNAMGESPNVGSGTEANGGQGDKSEDRVARIVAAGQASGMKFKDAGKTRH